MPNRDYASKLAFFNLTSQDVARFPRAAAAMARHAPPALDQLYDKIARTPQTAGLFASRAQMQHARDKQVEHWAAMFGSAHDES
ncbi:protoglobin domain-containing protein, partial [Acinetobacter baumannii]